MSSSASGFALRSSRLGVRVWAALGVALGLIVWLGLQLVGGLTSLGEAERDAAAMGHLSGRILLLDELLTGSARLAAVSGDPSWEARYLEHEPELSRLIQTARAQIPEAADGFALVEEANGVLVELEHASLAAAAEGDRERACSLLDGEEYAHHKERYSRGLDQAVRAIEAHGAQALARLRRGLLLEAVVAILSVLALVLAGLVGVRRWRAVSSKLEIARKSAESSERAKDELLSNVSHEMRTPLNGVLGAVELLLATDLSEDQRDYASTVRQSGRRSLQMVGDLLDFASIESGKMVLEESDLDLRRVASSILELYSSQAEAKDLRLTAEVEPGVPRHLRGDPLRYQQALSQLVSNAIKFTQTGTVSIRIGADIQEGDRWRVRTHVTDTGAGIEAARIPFLFRCFDYGECVGVDGQGGTGLGLALAKELALLMGGGIEVKSELGRGSTFSFTATFGSLALSEAEPSRLAGQRALIVNDGSANQQDAWELMLCWGARTECVQDLPEAIIALRRARAEGRPFRFLLFQLGPQIGALEELLAEIGGTDAVAFFDSDAIPPTHHPRLHLLGRPMGQSELYDRIQGLLEHSEHGPRPMPSDQDPRVLVVEDNPVNQKVARYMLEGLGYAVTVAGHGGVALEILETQRFDLVLMDCQMPEVDGYAATREIRRREGGGRHTPVVALTANALAGDREKCLKAGMDDFMAKPVERAVLQATLERWVGSQDGELAQ
jgi:two-component system, sensor histidine kinase and response regulator